jgi:hypothetical protein
MQTEELNRKLLAAASVPFVLGIGWIAFLLRIECSNTLLFEAVSPNGKHKLNVFERKCNDVEAWITNVSVLPVQAQTPKEEGNVLVLSERHGPVAGWPSNHFDVRARWINANEAEIRYSAQEAIQPVTTFFGGVNVKHIHVQ